ncbi:hypothetical protein ABK040_016455 [Willaertia magna]
MKRMLSHSFGLKKTITNLPKAKRYGVNNFHTNPTTRDEIESNEIYLWGSFGTDSFPIPERLFSNPSIFNNQKVIDVACGSEHIIFLTEEGYLYSMGVNKSGQCGYPASKDFLEKPYIIQSFAEELDYEWLNIPIQQTFNSEMFEIFKEAESIENSSAKKAFMTDKIRFGKVCCSRDTTFAITKDKKHIFACGLNDCSQLGMGYTTSPFQTKLFKLPLPSEIIEIDDIYSGCSKHAFIKVKVKDQEGNIKDNVIYGSGDNQFSQLGLGHFFHLNEVARVPLSFLNDNHSRSIDNISCGITHSILLTSEHGNGEVYSVGRGMEGQLGNSTKFSNEWRKIESLSNVQQITCGVNHNVVTKGKENGDAVDVYGWGSTIFYNPQFEPKLLLKDVKIKYLASGFNHSLLLTDDGLLSIGVGSSYQLGSKNRSNSEEEFIKVSHPNPKEIRKIVSGYAFNISI